VLVVSGTVTVSVRAFGAVWNEHPAFWNLEMGYKWDNMRVTEKHMGSYIPLNISMDWVRALLQCSENLPIRTQGPLSKCLRSFENL
jgi:hypothetical protein